MTDGITFETPENVEVTYEPAGLGSRFAAWVLDQFLIAVLAFGILVGLICTGIASEVALKQLVESVDPSDPESLAHTELYFLGLIYIVFALGSFVYFGFLELFFRGQTLGKRRMGIRVVQANGFMLQPSSIFLRTIFRVVDHMPPAWLVPLVSRRFQRLGDMVAGTVVVKDEPEDVTDLRERLVSSDPSDVEFRFTSTQLAKAKPQDFEVAERLIERLSSMNQLDQEQFLAQIVGTICNRIGIELPAEEKQAQFLKDILTAKYRHEYRRLG